SHPVSDRNYHGKSRRAHLELGRFRRIFVLGQWLRERILSTHHELALDPGRVVATEHPLIDVLRWLAAQGGTRQRRDRRRVLCAPAQVRHEFEGESYSTSTITSFAPYLEDLKQCFEVAVSIHPRDRKNSPLGSSTDLSPVAEQLVASDVVISDCSSVI